TWNVEVWSASDLQQGLDRSACKGSFTHSTWKGMLISKEELQRTRPNFVPTLTARGAARLSVLSLCDGRRTLAEIEEEVYRRHPRLFPSRSQAAAFVAEV